MYFTSTLRDINFVAGKHISFISISVEHLLWNRLLGGWRFFKWSVHKYSGKPSPPVVYDWKRVCQILVLLHVLRLVHAEVVQFNLALWQGVSLSWYYGGIDDVALPAPRNVFQYDCGESPASLWPSTKRSKTVLQRFEGNLWVLSYKLISLFSCSVLILFQHVPSKCIRCLPGYAMHWAALVTVSCG